MNTSSLPTIFPVTSHTDFVGQGSIFVAIPGTKYDGVQFIPLALEKGASEVVIHDSVVLNNELMNLLEQYNARVTRTSNPRRFLAEKSAECAGFPARSLKIIGITGTKGKTTTSFLLFHILKTSGSSAALLSTVKNCIGTEEWKATLTTAQPDYLHQFLKTAREKGVTHVVMEVAAQALPLYRVHGIEFDAVVMTNFSLEHLEFFSSMEEYFAAKCALFDMRKKHAPLFINIDNEWCRRVNSQDMRTFGSGPDVAYRFQEHRRPGRDAVLELFVNDASYIITCPYLFGTYNCYNIVAASAVAQYCGVPFERMHDVLKSLQPIPGRLQSRTLANGALAIVDYAHNPDSYEQLLSTLHARTSHLIVVFGAGGERDASRRPLMGAVAARYAQVIILTADNPRSEDPHAIVNDIKKGIHARDILEVHEIIDRAAAIIYACSISRPDSIIAVLGKGPDEYQIIGSQTMFFSDAHILQQL